MCECIHADISVCMHVVYVHTCCFVYKYVCVCMYMGVRICSANKVAVSVSFYLRYRHSDSAL